MIIRRRCKNAQLKLVYKIRKQIRTDDDEEARSSIHAYGLRHIGSEEAHNDRQIAVVVIQWHYPSDVVGGILVVSSWTFAVIAGLRLLRPRGSDGPPRERRETASGRFAVSLQ